MASSRASLSLDSLSPLQVFLADEPNRVLSTLASLSSHDEPPPLLSRQSHGSSSRERRVDQLNGRHAADGESADDRVLRTPPAVVLGAHPDGRATPRGAATNGRYCSSSSSSSSRSPCDRSPVHAGVEGASHTVAHSTSRQGHQQWREVHLRGCTIDGDTWLDALRPAHGRRGASAPVPECSEAESPPTPATGLRAFTASLRQSREPRLAPVTEQTLTGRVMLAAVLPTPPSTPVSSPASGEAAGECATTRTTGTSSDAMGATTTTLDARGDAGSSGPAADDATAVEDGGSSRQSLRGVCSSFSTDTAASSAGSPQSAAARPLHRAMTALRELVTRTLREVDSRSSSDCTVPAVPPRPTAFALAVLSEAESLVRALHRCAFYGSHHATEEAHCSEASLSPVSAQSPSSVGEGGRDGVRGLASSRGAGRHQRDFSPTLSDRARAALLSVYAPLAALMQHPALSACASSYTVVTEASTREGVCASAPADAGRHHSRKARKTEPYASLLSASLQLMVHHCTGGPSRDSLPSHPHSVEQSRAGAAGLADADEGLREARWLAQFSQTDGVLDLVRLALSPLPAPALGRAVVAGPSRAATPATHRPSDSLMATAQPGRPALYSTSTRATALRLVRCFALSSPLPSVCADGAAAAGDSQDTVHSPPVVEGTIAAASRVTVYAEEESAAPRTPSLSNPGAVQQDAMSTVCARGVLTLVAQQLLLPSPAPWTGDAVYPLALELLNSGYRASVAQAYWRDPVLLLALGAVLRRSLRSTCAAAPCATEAFRINAAAQGPRDVHAAASPSCAVVALTPVTSARPMVDRRAPFSSLNSGRERAIPNPPPPIAVPVLAPSSVPCAPLNDQAAALPAPPTQPDEPCVKRYARLYESHLACCGLLCEPAVASAVAHTASRHHAQADGQHEKAGGRENREEQVQEQEEEEEEEEALLFPTNNALLHAALRCLQRMCKDCDAHAIGLLLLVSPGEQREAVGVSVLDVVVSLLGQCCSADPLAAQAILRLFGDLIEACRHDSATAAAAADPASLLMRLCRADGFLSAVAHCLTLEVTHTGGESGVVQQALHTLALLAPAMRPARAVQLVPCCRVAALSPLLAAISLAVRPTPVRRRRFTDSAECARTLYEAPQPQPWLLQQLLESGVFSMTLLWLAGTGEKRPSTPVLFSISATRLAPALASSPDGVKSANSSRSASSTTSAAGPPGRTPLARATAHNSDPAALMSPIQREAAALVYGLSSAALEAAAIDPPRSSVHGASPYLQLLSTHLDTLVRFVCTATDGGRRGLVTSRLSGSLGRLELRAVTHVLHSIGHVLERELSHAASNPRTPTVSGARTTDSSCNSPAAASTCLRTVTQTQLPLLLASLGTNVAALQTSSAEPLAREAMKLLEGLLTAPAVSEKDRCSLLGVHTMYADAAAREGLMRTDGCALGHDNPVNASTLASAGCGTEAEGPPPTVLDVCAAALANPPLPVQETGSAATPTARHCHRLDNAKLLAKALVLRMLAKVLQQPEASPAAELDATELHSLDTEQANRHGHSAAESKDYTLTSLADVLLAHPLTEVVAADLYAHVCQPLPRLLVTAELCYLVALMRALACGGPRLADACSDDAAHTQSGRGQDHQPPQRARRLSQLSVAPALVALLNQGATAPLSALAADRSVSCGPPASAAGPAHPLAPSPRSLVARRSRRQPQADVHAPRRVVGETEGEGDALPSLPPQAACAAAGRHAGGDRQEEVDGDEEHPLAVSIGARQVPARRVLTRPSPLDCLRAQQPSGALPSRCSHRASEPGVAAATAPRSSNPPQLCSGVTAPSPPPATAAPTVAVHSPPLPSPSRTQVTVWQAPPRELPAVIRVVAHEIALGADANESSPPPLARVAGEASEWGSARDTAATQHDGSRRGEPSVAGNPCRRSSPVEAHVTPPVTVTVATPTTAIIASSSLSPTRAAEAFTASLVAPAQRLVVRPRRRWPVTAAATASARAVVHEDVHEACTDAREPELGAAVCSIEYRSPVRTDSAREADARAAQPPRTRSPAQWADADQRVVFGAAAEALALLLQVYQAPSGRTSASVVWSSAVTERREARLQHRRRRQQPPRFAAVAFTGAEVEGSQRRRVPPLDRALLVGDDADSDGSPPLAATTEPPMTGSGRSSAAHASDPVLPAATEAAALLAGRYHASPVAGELRDAVVAAGGSAAAPSPHGRGSTGHPLRQLDMHPLEAYLRHEERTLQQQQQQQDSDRRSAARASRAEELYHLGVKSARDPWSNISTPSGDSRRSSNGSGLHEAVCPSSLCYAEVASPKTAAAHAVAYLLKELKRLTGSD